MRNLKKNLAIFIAALPLVLAPFSSGVSNAAVIAVVDSGTDLLHPDLVKKAWNNPGEIDDGVDNDNNGFVDDLHGWNFPDNNNRLVDRKLIGTFPADVFKYFELQTKALNGQATDDEKAWLRAKVQDESFVQVIEKFANHMHGTHVAGISARDADLAELMVLRMIGGGSPTRLRAGLEELARIPLLGPASQASRGVKDKLIYAALTGLAMAQGQGVAPVGKYIQTKKAQVANCSFGASRRSIEPVIKPLIEKILGVNLSDEQLHVYADFFLNKTALSMQQALTAPSPTTLFVMAAGNDGTDNDVAPTSPANIKADNTITVAATLGRSRLASFSNYGAKMVDLAAPGVGILSTLPGGGYIQISGTSQAAPFVTNIGGRILDANNSLSVVDVKRILVETVDKKDFLAGVVSSAGIANAERAIYAAQLSKSLDLEQAIAQANREVASENDVVEQLPWNDAAFSVLPLPSFIQ